MIAGRHVIVVASGILDRVVLEQFGALLLETTDASLLCRHLWHALTTPWPAPDERSWSPDALAPEPEDYGDCVEPILCARCRAEVAVTAGTGPHVARARCACGAWRWLGRAELARAGLDVAGLLSAASAQLDLGGEKS